MKYLARKFAQAKNTIFAAVLSGLLLSACGGGSSAVGVILSSIGVGGTGIGVGGTGIVLGAVTGFGSVIVNDDRFITKKSKFIVDGEELDQSALAIGMVVRLKVETEDGEYTGEAIEVIYDDEVEGPVENLIDNLDGTSTFDVFGQSITVDDIGTRFANTTYATIKPDDIVEISGFRISDSEIFATYVEKTGDLVLGTSKVELRGTIVNYIDAPESFEIKIADGVPNVKITVDRSDPELELEVPNGILENYLYVEVEGIIQAQNPTVIIAAKEIELEDEDLGEEVDDVRLQGIISKFEVAGPGIFEIDGQVIDANGADIEPAGAMLGNGIEVEVEGDIVGGVLFADEVEVEEEETKLRSFISSVDVDDNSFEVDFPLTIGMSTKVVVRVDSQTVFEDDVGDPINTDPFSLDDLRPNPIEPGVFDYVRVEGTEVNDEILATVVKRVDPDDERRLEGIVDDYLEDSFIMILGITYQLDGSTSYGTPKGDIEIGDFVEVSDEDDPDEVPPILPDGIADEVEEE